MKSTLVIIPGHLGKDPGAIGLSDDLVSAVPEQQEQWINLQQCIALVTAYTSISRICKLDFNLILALPKSILKNYLFNIKEISEKFSISKRIKVVNEFDADVFEIHNNSAISDKANGCEVLVYSLTNKNGGKSEATIVGECILSKLSELGLKNRGVIPSYDRVAGKFVGRELPILTKTKNMSLIIESGFMSNKINIGNIDVDLDGFNEQVGMSILFGYIAARNIIFDI